ncbi:MAG: dephospho-CoA kinase [Chloroflexi bacterium]|nr:dephospho-CoA kinase [Chloroflexota bacterium]
MMQFDDAKARQGRQPEKRRIVIGLTGPIASGKSTVASYLRERGADIVDADRVYRSLLAPGSELARRIVARFGPGVVAANGDIDRSALGDLVFQDADALADLDQITHPKVVDEIRTMIDRSNAPVVVVEAIKLAQSGLASDIDSLWLVTADEATRLQRLMTRAGMDEAKARARIAAASGRVPDGIRVDFAIDNSGDIGATLRAVDDAWQALLSDKMDTRQHEIVPTQEEPS